MKAKNFEELIKKYNPFGIKDDEGDVMLFDDYGKMYSYVLKFLKEQCPKGYIDIPLLMHMLTRQPLSVCITFVRKNTFIRCLGGMQNISRDYIYFCPPVDGVFPKEKIENLFNAFHTISETHLMQGYFNVAWDEYIQLRVKS